MKVPRFSTLHRSAVQPSLLAGAPAAKRHIAALIAIVTLTFMSLANTSRANGMALRVGPQHALKTPSAAAAVAADGDVIEIDAGTYAGDAAVWRQNNLTIRAVGGRAHLRADGAHAEEKAIWVIKGRNTTIENIDFSGAKVRHRNGAGIRLEGAGLTVRHCRFHHNEMGILTGANLESHIVIEHSEFSHNMRPDGHNHNVYIGTVSSFTLRYSYVHHATYGHNVKSRALKSFIEYNRIMDQHDGRASYALEFPDGGLSFVIGNLIQQGPLNDNPTVVSYGAEGLKNPLNELYFVSNTVVNDDPAGGRFLFVKEGTDAVRVVNNIFSGPGELLVDKAEFLSNARVPNSDFVDFRNFDYRLRGSSRAIGRAVETGTAWGVPLQATAQYVHPMQKRARTSTRDIGALQFEAPQ